MNQRPTIREQIDACRPDSDDLHLPEHDADRAELHGSLRESPDVRGDCERIQRNDRIIRSAMQDVSLPAGLEAKLLAAVQAAQAVPLAGVEQVVRTESTTTDNLVVQPRVPASRRWFLKVAAGVATTAALVVIGFMTLQSFRQTEQPITTDQLASQAEEWLRAVDPHAMRVIKPIPSTFPSDIVLGTVDRVGTVSTNHGSITAYLVKNPANGVIARLLVIPTTRTYPVGTLPLSNIPGVSGGWQVRAWQRGGVLYVIAVPADSGAPLDQFIRQQPIG